MVDQTVRKAGRFKRLWPGRAAALPPAPRPLRSIDPAPALPPRGLTAAELIAMARQARTVADQRDPTESADVS